MRPFKDDEEVYAWCLSEGNLIPQIEINLGRVKSNLSIAQENLESAKDSILKKRWNTAYKLYYDVIHQLVESLLIFDKVKSTSHQCLYASLCVKHPELELSWDFFEKIRTKRNGMNYYGAPVQEKDWKEVGLPFELYINLLTKEIKNRLK